MLIQKLGQLWPYFALHFVFAIVLCLVAYAALSKWLKPLNIQWTAALILGVALTVYHSGSVLINVLDFTGGAAATGQATAQNEKDKPKTLQDLKGEFLRAIDQLTGEPASIKPEVKAQLFSQFAALFQSPKDKQAYYENISRVYDCQKYLLMDAQVSQQTKSPIKSQNRIDCEKSDGSFFNREKLLAPETIAGNDKLIEIVSKKKMTEQEQKEYSPELISKTLEVQKARLEAVKKIFE